MKITEVTDKNKTIINIYGLREEYEEDFRVITSAFNLFMLHKRRSNLQRLSDNNIAVLHNELVKFLTVFEEEIDDADVVKYKLRANEMLSILENYRSQIQKLLK